MRYQCRATEMTISITHLRRLFLTPKAFITLFPFGVRLLSNLQEYVASTDRTIVSSNIAQNPIFSKRFYTFSLDNLFNRTTSRLLQEASSHAAANVRKLFIHKYPPLYIARYSSIQRSELEQYRVETRFDATVQDTSPGYLCRESETLATAQLRYNVRVVVSPLQYVCLRMYVFRHHLSLSFGKWCFLYT